MTFFVLLLEKRLEDLKVNEAKIEEAEFVEAVRSVIGLGAESCEILELDSNDRFDSYFSISSCFSETEAIFFSWFLLRRKKNANNSPAIKIMAAITPPAMAPALFFGADRISWVDFDGEGVGEDVGDEVETGVEVGVGVAVAVEVGVEVGLGVGVDVGIVGVGVGVGEGEEEDVGVGVAVGVAMGVGVGVQLMPFPVYPGLHSQERVVKLQNPWEEQVLYNTLTNAKLSLVALPETKSNTLVPAVEALICMEIL